MSTPVDPASGTSGDQRSHSHLKSAPGFNSDSKPGPSSGAECSPALPAFQPGGSPVPPILCLSGPTAAGKSAASLALAARWPIEIICMDSATVYRGMDIGTAKPDASERNTVPHHLLDIRDPMQAYSAAEFARDAHTLFTDIRQRGRLPLLCGGTLLYYKALRDGLNALPSADPQVRAELDCEAARLGWPALHAQLHRVDPLTASRLAPNDSQRIQRALEVYRLSGRPLSEWHAQPTQERSPERYVTLSLEPSDRLALHTRIAQRFQAMMDAGLLSEVERLYSRGDLHANLPSIRSVGYRQLWQHLETGTPLTEAVEQAIAATRQLAKRQLTWLRADTLRLAVDCLSSGAAARIVDLAARHWP